MAKILTNRIFIGMSMIGFTSCTFYHYMCMSHPGDESKVDIANFLDRKEIEYSYSTFLKDSCWTGLGDSIHYLNTYKYRKGTSPSPIQLRVYNDSGDFVSGYSQCYGPFKRLNILKEYPPVVIPHLPNNTQLRFEDELQLFQVSDASRRQIIGDSRRSDYTLVVYWNMWSGYFSEVVLKEASEYFVDHNSDSARVTLILVNTGVDIPRSEF